MKRVILVHRWSGGGADDWRPWLKSELEKLGFEVFSPTMPNVEEPVIEEWVNYLRGIVGEADSETYFIGHSIGCQTILRYLETLDKSVGGAVFVAGWFKLANLEDEEVRKIAEPWMNAPIDKEKVKRVLPKSTLIISDNDPYNCFEENMRGFEDIVTKTVVVPGGGHFTEDDGFKEFPKLLEEFKELV